MAGEGFRLPGAENDAPLRQLRSELRIEPSERELFELKRSSSLEADSGNRIEKLETELLELKLDESRKLVEQFPNDYSQRFKYGSYLLESGDVDAGIQQFQISQRSPSLRLKSLVLLGRCFAGRGFSISSRTAAARSGGNKRDGHFKKEVLYLLAECYENWKDPKRRLNSSSYLLNDIGYRDVAEKIDAFYRNP